MSLHENDQEAEEEEGFDLREDHHCGRTVGDPLHLAICEGVRKGITFVVAAGNEEEDTRESAPAGYREVITVGGLADTDGKPGGKGPENCAGSEFNPGDDLFAFFSNYGHPVDVLAVATCDVTDYLEGTIAEDNGTSFATPAVSGAAALLLDKNPSLKPYEVKQIIRRMAERNPRLPEKPHGTTGDVLDVAGF